MKNTFFLFILSSFLFFISCCEKDDDSSETTTNLTSTNNLFEGDLYKIHLNSEIENLQNEIALIKEMDITEKELDLISTKLENISILQDKITVIQNNSQVFISQEKGKIDIGDIDPPPPPGPCGAGTRCIPAFKYLSLIRDPDLISVSLKVSNNETDEQITTIEINSNTFEDNETILSSSIDLGDFEGFVNLVVTRTNENNETMEYTIDSVRINQ